jgi:hypothetical protein
MPELQTSQNSAISNSKILLRGVLTSPPSVGKIAGVADSKIRESLISMLYFIQGGMKRGTFAATLLLDCLVAMELEGVALEEI